MILKELDFDKQVLDNSSFLELKKIGFPNKKNEDYRHISLRNMLEKKLLIADKEDNELCNDLYKEGYKTS